MNRALSIFCWLAIFLAAIFIATKTGRGLDVLAAEATGESLGSQLLEDLDPRQFAPPPTKPPSTPPSMPRPVPATPREPKRALPGIADKILGEDIGGFAAASPLVRVKQNMEKAKSLLGEAGSINGAAPFQEQVVADLDALIEQLTKQCCSGGSKTSGQPKPGSQRSQASSGKAGSKPGSGTAPARDSTPQLRSGKPQTESLAERESLVKNLWGHLPPHVREQMLQAHSDEFLPQYELEIEAYFRRLAEDVESANE